ncbi:hypothetical protein AB0J90_27555 [Micromonospora sp. NPDC049523]|uniref:hypothetical protein n=1 Tax=Micromonospora sp. NPDC049523 TaxID=3155921 RepID=UPI003423C8FF
MRRLLQAAVATATLAVGVAAIPQPASAAGCQSIQLQQMRFADESPFRASYSSSARVTGYAYDDYTYTMNGVCTSTAGNLWYRRAADGAPSVYIYSGHRIG